MEKKANTARRSFFAGVGIAAAAGLAAKLTPTAEATAAIVPGVPEEPQGSKYRLTEHIKKYYRTTSI